MLQLRLTLATLSACLFLSARLIAADGYMAVVTASPGKVMGGTKLLGTVPNGAQLWVFQEQKPWLEVKLPGQEQRGWMQQTELERVRRTDAQEARLQAAKEHHRRSDEHKVKLRLPEALAEMRLALGERREVLGNEHPSTITTLGYEAFLFYVDGDFPAARTRFEDSLASYRKVLGNEHRFTAQALNNLAAVDEAQGDYTAARKRLEDALAINRKALGNEHPRTAGVLGNLGTVVRKQGEFAVARNYSAESLAIKRKVLGDEHRGAADALERLAVLSEAEGDLVAAAQTWDQALRSLRRQTLRTLFRLSREERAQYLENLDLRSFRDALSLGRTAVANPEIAELSAGWILNGKGVTAEALAAAARFDSPQCAPRLQSLRATCDRLTELGNQPTSEERNRELAVARRMEQMLIRDLSVASGCDLTADPWIDLDHVRQAVPKTSVLISFARVRPYDFQAKERLAPVYVAWVIPAADQGEIRIVDLGDAKAVDAAVAALRQAVAKTPADFDAVRKTSAALADLVWKPLAESLADKEELILCPDGALWLTPWAALPIGKDKFLIEQYRLRYVTSGRELLAADDAKDVTPGPARIVADPDYDQSERDTLAAYLATLYPGYALSAIPASPEHRPIEQPAPRSVAAIGRVERLPDTGVEATLVAPQLKLLTGVEPRMYVERNAQEGIVKLIRNPRVLMLCSHAYFLPDQQAKFDERHLRLLAGESIKRIALDENGDVIENPLLRCGLLLAGSNERDKYKDPRLGDGLMTGMDAADLDLRGTELVVLSACETGVDTNNGEGVAGLRQAFQLAGAKSVVSTLWQIPDRQSAVLMNDFFTNLAADKSRADALRDAQLAMIKSRREKYGAAHPLFWAAWTITGN